MPDLPKKNELKDGLFGPDRFPVRTEFVYLSHCGIAPLYSGAARAAAAYDQAQSRLGALAFRQHEDAPQRVHRAAARLLDLADPEGSDVAFTRNTAEGLSLLANGFPFEPGDEILSYVHEYPSNHYPWRLQEQRGVRLVLVPDKSAQTTDRSAQTSWAQTTNSATDEVPRPLGFTLADVAARITKRTRLVAVSHVQFTSGFAVDLPALGALCKERGVFLVLDAAQSLGALPVYPERWHVDAVAASCWKWLLGPVGTGLLYTSPRLRDMLRVTMAGADLMTQGDDYLNHSWQPFRDGRLFEYSTVPIAPALAVAACMDELANTYGIEQIAERNRKLARHLLDRLDPERFERPALAPENHSGIHSVILRPRAGNSPADDPAAFVKRALGKGVLLSARGGYVRLAPHFYQDEVEMERAAEVLNRL